MTTFWKGHGTGNDFVIVDQQDLAGRPLREKEGQAPPVRRLTAQELGPGV